MVPGKSSIFYKYISCINCQHSAEDRFIFVIDVYCRTYNANGPVEEIKLVDDALNVVRVDVEDDEHLKLMVRRVVVEMSELILKV